MALVSLFLATGCPSPDDAADPFDTGVTGAADAGDGGDLDDVNTSEDSGIEADGTAEEQMRIEGLSAPVEVRLDAWGIPHFQCETDADCVASLGYFHARDRFVQMDVARRVARGEISTLVPLSELVDFDATNRALMMTTDGEWIEDAMLAVMDDETRTLAEAYARGVNAWLDDFRNQRNNARLSGEYEHPVVQADQLRDWEVRDSLAMWAFDRITASYSRQIRLGEIFTALDPQVATDLMGPATVTPMNPFDASGESFPALVDGRGAPSAPATDHLRGARGVLASAHRHIWRLKEILGDPLPTDGSNAWAVGPSRSRSGHALMAQDEHRQITNPVSSYLAEIDAVSSGEGTLHAAGYGTPGAPLFFNGFNEHVAWGSTSAVFDDTDVYVETLSGSGDGVVFRGEDVPFGTREYQVGTATRTLRWVPHHGPVLAIDSDAGTALTVRSTAHEPARLVGDIVMMKEWMRSTTLEEFREASAHGGPHDAALVVIDTDDNFGLVTVGAVPRRSWASLDGLYPELPLPGDGSAEWGELVGFDQLPVIENPAAGFVTTSNQPLTDSHVDGDPTNDGRPMLQSYATQNFRHQRVVDLLSKEAEHSFETVRDIHGDDYSIVAQMTLPEILATAETLTLSPGAMEVTDRLADWDYRCPSGLDGYAPDAPKATDTAVIESSIACTTFHTLLFLLLEAALGDELALAGSRRVRVDRGGLRPLRDIVFLLNDPTRFVLGDAYWDDVDTAQVTESRDDVIRASLEATPGELAARFAADVDDQRWGMHIQLVREAPLFSGLTPQFDDGPYPLSGAFAGIQDYRARAWMNTSPDYEIHRGATTRLVVLNTDGGLQAKVQLPGGQAHHRESDHYDDLLKPYLANEYVDFAFGPEAYEAASVETTLIQPGEPR